MNSPYRIRHLNELLEAFPNLTLSEISDIIFEHEIDIYVKIKKDHAFINEVTTALNRNAFTPKSDAFGIEVKPMHGEIIGAAVGPLSLLKLETLGFSSVEETPSLLIYDREGLNQIYTTSYKETNIPFWEPGYLSFNFKICQKNTHTFSGQTPLHFERSSIYFELDHLFIKDSDENRIIEITESKHPTHPEILQAFDEGWMSSFLFTLNKLAYRYEEDLNNAKKKEKEELQEILLSKIPTELIQNRKPSFLENLKKLILPDHLNGWKLEKSQSVFESFYPPSSYLAIANQWAKNEITFKKGQHQYFVERLNRERSVPTSIGNAIVAVARDRMIK
ncbi:hypothetical protein [Halospina sp. K52047b]|uniref:hypothetical protein n=1 Tax=Halospina sp. K52047b TaxID=2614160 RepID=UPI00124AE01A|nr:hypothetical protein [Halospina sp. K52047b]KAA8985196.1 hypothetical protein F3089_00445 [Halospina sp. K52047b]